MQREFLKSEVTNDKNFANEKSMELKGNTDILNLEYETETEKPEYGLQKVLYNIWERIKFLATVQESEGLIQMLPAHQVLEYSKRVCPKMPQIDLQTVLSISREVIAILEETNVIKIILGLVTDKPLLHEDEYKIPDLEVLTELTAMQVTKCQLTVNFLLSRVFKLLETILQDTEIKELLLDSNRLYSSGEILSMAASFASDYASYFSHKYGISMELPSKL